MTAPATAATEARNEAIAGFGDAHECDNIAEMASAEQRTANEFLERLAEAVVDGLSVAQAKQHCDVVADAADHYNKTTLVELLEEKIEEQREAGSGRRPFDEILDGELREVVVIRTTDSKQETQYRWHFNGGSVETRTTAEGREHFSWPRFRDEYYDAVGEDPAKPNKNLRGGEEWREFVVELIEERGREVTTRGPRTTAVDSLQNYIRRSDAYGDLGHVVQRDGVYLDADPMEGEPEELWILNHHAKRIADEAELNSVRALQAEIDSRGYTIDERNGVSHSTFVNNNKATFWVLDPDIATPASFVAEPVDPAEQVRREQEQDDDEDGDNEPGALGSVGGDQ